MNTFLKVSKIKSVLSVYAENGFLVGLVKEKNKYEVFACDFKNSQNPN
jgi:hypothetical protein